jgi:transitional endoplasmic reticulum ATPase
MQAAPVNEFLAQMSNCSDKGIFVIAASNRPEKIDPAILRTGRIDRIIYLPPPDFDARVSMFKLYLKKRPIDLGLNYEKLAELTENYVSSDIKFLVDEASRTALKIQARITQEIFEKVISTNKPSVSNAELKKYELLKDKLEDKKTNQDEPRRPIGFR